MHKILVVDDKPPQLELICFMLDRLDVECIVAHSGLEAVELAKQLQPDLILMDWIMPSETLTGTDATLLILGDSATHHIPVIACSALGDLSEAMEVGCVDCVRKPFSVDLLLNKIRHYLL